MREGLRGSGRGTMEEARIIEFSHTNWNSRSQIQQKVLISYKLFIF
jgi:hypothetical protein